jgi:hypothetical protein
MLLEGFIKVKYCFYMISLHDPILSHMNPIHSTTPYYLRLVLMLCYIYILGSA